MARSIGATRFVVALLLGPPMVGCGEEPAHAVIPSTVELAWTDTFHVTEATRVTIAAGSADAERIGHLIAAWIGNTVETTPEVVVVEAAADASIGPAAERSIGPAPGPSIHLALDEPSSSTDLEGYQVVISEERVDVSAPTPAGLFYAALSAARRSARGTLDRAGRELPTLRAGRLDARSPLRVRAVSSGSKVPRP